jgi:hypothetical protein
MENNRLPVFFLLGLLFIVSCKRKDNVGKGLVPDANNSSIFYTDSLTLITRTLAEDSLVTSELSYNILGTSNNSIFDQSRANVSAQYSLPRDNFSFGGATKFDSAVLYISFLSPDASEGNRSFGDLNANQRFTIHELTDGLDASRQYYNNSAINYDALSIGSWYGKLNMFDSVPIVVGGSSTKIPPCLHFKLDQTWAKNKLFNAPASAFSTNTDFLNYFKGLSIVSEAALSPGNGGFVYVNLKPNNKFNIPNGAALVVYYNDTQAVSFTVSSKSRRVNTYVHEITQASLPRTYAYTGSLSNTDTCFIQAMGRYKMKIEIPYLYDLAKDHEIAINSAELIIKPYDNLLTPDYYAPTSLRLLQPNDSTGRNDFIKDIFFAGSSPINPYYGGTYNVSANEYRFNFTLHAQQLLNNFKATGSKAKNKGLYVIIPTDNPIAASHVVMDTRKGSGIKVRIYYTIQN